MGGGGDMTDVSVEMSRMESVVCQMPLSDGFPGDLRTLAKKLVHQEAKKLGLLVDKLRDLTEDTFYNRQNDHAFFYYDKENEGSEGVYELLNELYEKRYELMEQYGLAEELKISVVCF